MFLLFQTDLTYGQYGVAGALLVAIGLVLGFLLRALPSWKEVRLAEVSVREKEAEARAAQAASFGQLSDALKTMSDVLNNVAIEQKHSTDKVQILQRVNADAVQHNADLNEANGEKIDRVIEMCEYLGSRMTSVEKLISPK